MCVKELNEMRPVSDVDKDVDELQSGFEKAVALCSVGTKRRCSTFGSLASLASALAGGESEEETTDESGDESEDNKQRLKKRCRGIVDDIFGGDDFFLGAGVDIEN